jgi:hypothetical protein
VRLLITAVESEWFLYFHSDVYLPDGWFNIMRSYQSEYDWFGCPMRITALVEYPLIDRIRPYAGTQMDTFHWHQVMPRVYGDERRARKFTGVKLDVEMTKEEELYTLETQLRGTIKYLPPDSTQVSGARANFWLLQRAGAIDLDEFYPWVARTSPEWIHHLDVVTVPVTPPSAAEQTKSASRPLPSLVASPIVVLFGLLLLMLRRLTGMIYRIVRHLGRPFVGPPVVNGRLSFLYRTYFAAKGIDRLVRVAMVNQSRTMARAFEYLASQLEK